MINAGLDLSKSRIGADVILIASNGEFKNEEFLYSVKKTTRYFNKEHANFIDDYDEVKSKTEQFYVNDPNLKYKVVGINFDTDFLVKTWMKKNNEQALALDEAVVGADIDANDTIQVMGKTFKVKSSLYKTGTTMDNSVFVDMNVAREYADKSMKKFYFKGNKVDDSVTAIFIKLKEGKSASRFVDKVNFHTNYIKAISKAESISTLENSVMGFVKIISYLVLILVVNAFLALFGRYTALMKERKKEVGYLRSIGYAKGRVYLTLTFEILILAVISGLIGSLAVLITITPILDIVSNKFMFPKVYLSVGSILKIVISGPALSFLLGIISSFVPAIKTARMEPREAMARGEI